MSTSSAARKRARSQPHGLIIDAECEKRGAQRRFAATLRRQADRARSGRNVQVLRKACCCTPWRPVADVQDQRGGLDRYWRPCSVCFTSLGCSPTAPIMGRCFHRAAGTCPISRPRQAIRSGEGLRRHPGVGWSNAHRLSCPDWPSDWENLNRNALAFITASIRSKTL